VCVTVTKRKKIDSEVKRQARVRTEVKKKKSNHGKEHAAYLRHVVMRPEEPRDKNPKKLL
jgi:hypothetical protein